MTDVRTMNTLTEQARGHERPPVGAITWLAPAAAPSASGATPAFWNGLLLLAAIGAWVAARPLSSTVFANLDVDRPA